MNRQELLTTGGLALGAALLNPHELLAAPARTAAVVSWPHSLANLLQDDRPPVPSPGGASHTHWDLPHDNHRIDYCWKWMAGSASGTLGWLVFREQDAKNFLQVEHRVKGIALVKRVAGTFSDLAFFPRPVSPGAQFMQRLEMIGSDLSVYDLNTDGTVGARVLHATDSTYPSGVSFAYYSNGVLGCWEFAKGVPL